MPDPVVVHVEARTLVVPLPTPMHAFGYTSINVPFVTVTDGDGRRGTGFAYTLDDGAAVVGAMIDAVIAPRLRGVAAAEWPRVRRDVLQTTRRLGATAFTAAVSAVDIAMWDLRGVTEEAPLWRLLGGTPAPVPFYGSGRSGAAFSTDELVAQSLGYLADGFAGVKLGIGGPAPADDVARVSAVRDAIGPDVPLMVDASERLDLPRALDLARRLAPFGLTWFEEPLLAEDVAGYRALAAASPIPIATGEHFQQGETLARYLAETDVAIYQPDAALGGGVTGMLAMAALAEAAHRPIAWHSLADLHVHLAAAVPGTRWIEDFPILDGIIADPLRPRDGVGVAPDRPGHGIRWDDDAIARWTRQ